MKEVEKFESYLGLPTLIGRAKNQTFSFLKDRVWKKLQGWKGLMLSRAGKEVLIKAVAQSIPTYTMGVFQLPKSLCDDLEAMYAKFWWGQVGNERKIHWKSWTSSTKKGGMGFRDLRSFNLAMLAKQGWRLIHVMGHYCLYVSKQNTSQGVIFLMQLCPQIALMRSEERRVGKECA